MKTVRCLQGDLLNLLVSIMTESVISKHFFAIKLSSLVVVSTIQEIYGVQYPE